MCQKHKQTFCIKKTFRVIAGIEANAKGITVRALLFKNENPTLTGQ